MIKNVSIALLVFSALSTTPSFAKSEKPVPATADAEAAKDTAVDDFRCEKFQEKSLAALKLKMVENCDLNKPFSSSMSLFMSNESYMYCCHAKK